MSIFNPFNRSSRAGAAWFNAGPTASYPNIENADSALAQQRLCNEKYLSGCKVYYVPKEDATQASLVAIDDWKDGETDTKNQVMIFQYNGKFVAVNHVGTIVICIVKYSPHIRQLAFTSLVFEKTTQRPPIC